MSHNVSARWHQRAQNEKLVWSEHYTCSLLVSWSLKLTFSTYSELRFYSTIGLFDPRRSIARLETRTSRDFNLTRARVSDDSHAHHVK